MIGFCSYSQQTRLLALQKCVDKMEHVSKKYGYLCLFTSYIKLFALYFAKCAWCSRNAKLSCSHLMLFISIATIGRVLWMFFDLMLYNYFMLSIAT